jgi:hypothetical protein
MFRHSKTALVAAAALTAAAWSLPAAANGQRPSGAAVGERTVDAAAPKKARRAAVRKRVASANRLRSTAPPHWFYRPYEGVIAHARLLIVGIGY